MANQEFYVACSITGTYSFITANRVFTLAKKPGYGEAIVLDGLNFTASQPRQGTSQRGAIKLIWPELNEDGAPPRNAQLILNKINYLRTIGWNVDDAGFKTKHKLTAPAEYIPTAVQSIASETDAARVPQPADAISENNSGTGNPTADTANTETTAPPINKPLTISQEFGIAKSSRLTPPQIALLRHLRDNCTLPVSIGDNAVVTKPVADSLVRRGLITVESVQLSDTIGDVGDKITTLNIPTKPVTD